eukprot:jgi/Astpho2/1416/fgenesh1_pm.00025_%23_13_t
MGPNVFVTIRRASLLQDGFDQLNKLGQDLKSRIRIQFINEHGIEEAGVDGGGLLKDFMESLIKTGFNPDSGLFRATEDNRLYPNPSALRMVPHALELYEFLGRMLGKVLYEGILVELPLAGFFLKKVRTMRADVNDLYTLDPELYNNLMFLRDYKQMLLTEAAASCLQGDFGDLALSFTTAESVLDGNQEIELVPGGRDRSVTSSNVVEYLHRVADHRLNQQIRTASEAFLRGFHDLIELDWVAMFNEEEMQMLISGGGEGFNVADARSHVNYAGGYHPDHPVMQNFWKAVETLEPLDRSKLLKFITACSRAPLLGFSYLQPPLCIQMAGSVLDSASTDRLPTAATCMNLLKLPPYRSAHEIREKLLYAANHATGFDLS